MALSNTKLRKAWQAYECKRERMREIAFGEDRILVAPPTVEAWQALYSVLEHHGYHVRVDDTDSYNCRAIKGKTVKSLHSYGIALDVNWHTNPWRDHPGTRPVKYSDKTTQDARGSDVKHGRADTDMTPEMIADVRAIKTNDGHQVFNWGGDWNSVKDAMHFEVRLAPADFEAGIDWQTVAGAGAASDPDTDTDVGAPDAEPEDYSRHEDYYYRLSQGETDIDWEDDVAGKPENGDGDFDLEFGDRGPLVTALQNALSDLGYQVGDIDGIFGRMTRDALLAFQADNEISTTGMYDAETMAALDRSQPRPIDAKRMRASEDDVIAGGSETLKRSRWNRRIGIGTIILGALGLTDKQTEFIAGSLDAIKKAAGGEGKIVLPDAVTEKITEITGSLPVGSGATGLTAEQIAAMKTKVSALAELLRSGGPTTGSPGLFESLLSLLQGLLSSGGSGIWPIIAIVGFMMWRNGDIAAKRRLDDHRTGANRKQ